MAQTLILNWPIIRSMFVFLVGQANYPSVQHIVQWSKCRASGCNKVQYTMRFKVSGFRQGPVSSRKRQYAGFPLESKKRTYLCPDLEF